MLGMKVFALERRPVALFVPVERTYAELVAFGVGHRDSTAGAGAADFVATEGSDLRDGCVDIVYVEVEVDPVFDRL